MTEPLATIGKSVQRIDAIEKVTGSAKYAPDLKMEGMLHAKLLRSPHAHARVKNIDTSRAEKVPGVRAIATIMEVPKVIEYWFFLRTEEKKKRMFLCDNVVRFIGDPVLAVARRILGRAGPWLVVALLMGPTVGANRMALALYDRTMDEHEPSPGVGALMADLRALHGFAENRAQRGLPTVLPSRRIPGKGRKSLSLADLDLFVASGKESDIRWVTVSAHLVIG